MPKRKQERLQKRFNTSNSVYQTNNSGHANKILIITFAIAILIITSSSSHQECPGPVSFNSSSFTIRGPCPNDAVLVANGSTIQYRCDYIDETGTTNLPYWYIPVLNGTPFLKGKGSEHGITIVEGLDGQSGHTTLTIPVKEQYLDNTLSIQCGLCSLNAFAIGNILSENIISTIGKMVTHGSPRHLSTSVVNGIVMFQWSRPLASDDNVVFIYTVQLMTNASSVPILSFNTTNTNITLSRLNITGNDRCIEYTSWSVSVANSYTMTVPNGGNISMTGGNISVIFQEEPSFNSDVTTTISSCSSTIRLELSFTVSSLQPLHTLDYDVWLNDTINISYYSKHNTSITFPQHQQVIIEIPLVSIPHDEDQLYITVTISNECGEDTIEDLPVNVSNTVYCAITSTPTVYDSSVNIQKRSSPTQSMTTTQTIVMPTTPITTPRQTERSSGSVPTIAGISSGVVIVLIIIIVIIVIMVLVFYRTRKWQTVSFDNPQIVSGAINTQNVNTESEQKTKPTSNVADYLTPKEAKSEKLAYKNPDENQYREPEQLKHGGSITLAAAVPLLTTSSAHVNQKGALAKQDIQNMPGYSDPNECIPPHIRADRLSGGIQTTTTSTGSVSCPLYEDVKEAKAQESQTYSEVLPTDNQLASHTYVDMNDIRAKKARTNTTSYAQLDLPDGDDSAHDQMPCPSAPIASGSSTTYSTIQ